jgi:AraC-like DNA-binding protein
MLSDVEMWTIYWQEGAFDHHLLPTLLEREFVFHVTPLIRGLVFRLFETKRESRKAATIADLILHEVAEAPTASLYLPLPVSEIGKRVANLVFDDIANHLDIDVIADRAATSSRTISRLFPLETGITFRSWRQRARIIAAIDGLSSGHPVSVVASRTGFATAAAFTFAFRHVTGVTPNMYQERSQSSAEPISAEKGQMLDQS